MSSPQRLAASPFRSYVLVSRDQIARNYRSVCAVVGPNVDVACVVKADAYGHGALEVARVLVNEGARWLAVSSVDEGVNLRCGGIREPRILVMGGFLSYEGAALVEHDLTATVHSLAQMRDLDRLAGESGRPIGFDLKIDSGMNRLGTRAMRIGVLGAGYADGVFHRMSNRGKVIADGKLTSILGTVSMDLTTIDLSHTTALAPGDDVTLLGVEGEARLDAQQIARVAGTISYNILCNISARVRRLYI